MLLGADQMRWTSKEIRQGGLHAGLVGGGSEQCRKEEERGVVEGEEREERRRIIERKGRKENEKERKRKVVFGFCSGFKISILYLKGKRKKNLVSFSNSFDCIVYF